MDACHGNEYRFGAERTDYAPIVERVRAMIFSMVSHPVDAIAPRRYAFPADPSAGVIDLTDERPFYFNEYSGELSLEFPIAERKFKGGILA